MYEHFLLDNPEIKKKIDNQKEALENGEIPDYEHYEDTEFDDFWNSYGNDEEEKFSVPSIDDDEQWEEV